MGGWRHAERFDPISTRRRAIRVVRSRPPEPVGARARGVPEPESGPGPGGARADGARAGSIRVGAAGQRPCGVTGLICRAGAGPGRLGRGECLWARDPFLGCERGLPEREREAEGLEDGACRRRAIG